MTTTTDDTTLAAIVLLIIGALVVLPVLFMSTGMMGVGHMDGTIAGSGMWADSQVAGWLLVAWILIRLLFLAAILGGLYLVVRAITTDDDTTDPALEELRQAYARGELSDEEYETRRNRLERDH